MLEKVLRPDKNNVTFAYDALGRRIAKRLKSTLTKWLWDGNKPLHEWKEFDFRESTPDDLITWVFEEDSFAPAAKIKGEKKYSLVCDHIGTPTQGYNEEGSLIWERELDSYGKKRQETGDDGFCTITYQGQVYDKDIDLTYNYFRWYNQEEGVYVSQDPIRLLSGQPNLYLYSIDVNEFIDPLGLSSYSKKHKKKEWDKARKRYWRNELKNNPNKYSPENKKRMKRGSAPQMRVTILKHGETIPEITNISMELHHTYIPQKALSTKGNENWNLTQSTPWGHSAMDPSRKINYELVSISKGVKNF